MLGILYLKFLFPKIENLSESFLWNGETIDQGLDNTE